MLDAPTIPDQLRHQATLLFALTSPRDVPAEIRAAELDALIHDAKAREHRRAAFNARDASCYRLGAAFEPAGALDLDPVALAGLLALGTTGLLLLVQVALGMPDASLPAQLRALFRSRAGRPIRDWGVWSRWHRLQALYVQETDAFLASPAGRDPKAEWRAKPPTAEQAYLAAAICLDLQIENRTFATRGASFDWIREQGGNPRYLNEPERPDLTAMAELFA